MIEYRKVILVIILEYFSLNDLYNTLDSRILGKVIECEIQLADENHPVFQAHFPSNHLLPGFLHIDIASELLNKKVIKINKAKFLLPILPLDKILFIIEEKEESYKITTKKENKKCSEFTVVTK